MSKVIKQVSPQELQAWDLSPDSKISYYDGKGHVLDLWKED